MAYALIANAAAESTNSITATTAAIDTTGANLIVLAVNRAVGVTPTDSKSNTWTSLTSRGTDPFTTIWYVFNPTVGTGHTFAVSVGNSYPSIFVSAWSGAVTSPFDAENGASSASASTLQPGSITPSENNELVITVVGSTVEGTTYSINGGFTITNQVDGADSLAYGGAMAYLIQTTAAAANPTWTLSGVRSCSAAIACFKDTPASTAWPGYISPFGWN